MGQKAREEQGGCTRLWGYLGLVFVLTLVVLFVELVSVVSRPEPLPATLTVPSTVLFRKIHTPRRNLPCLYNFYTTDKYVRARRLPDRLEQLRNATNNTITKIRKLDGPLFPHEPNTTGIVMTCKLGPLCLANLHHLFHNMNISLPVGLSSSSLSESVVLFHGMALMNRIVVETITNKKRRSAYVGKNIPW